MAKMTRKKIVEEIINNFQIIKNKMYGHVMSGRPGSMTHSQWFVMHLIGVAKKTSIKEISQVLGISSSAATQLVNGLQENDYVERTVDKKDRRELRLVISKQGKKEMAVMRKKNLALVQHFFKPLSQAELKQYVKLQKKILSSHSNHEA